MKFSIQRTTMWNRIAAGLLDFILLLILAVGAAWGVSAIAGYERYLEKYESGMNEYLLEYGIIEEGELIGSDKTYKEVLDLPFWKTIKVKEEQIASQFNGVDLDITPEKFNALNADSKSFYLGSDYEADYNAALLEAGKDAKYLAAKEKEKRLYEAEEAFSKDEEMIKAYTMVMNLPLLIVTLGILCAIVVLELIVPLIFKNGQTVGKKIFAIAVMHDDGIRVNGVYMFIRTIIGKFTFETMIPVYLITMILMGTASIVTIAVLVAIPVLQIILLCVTKNRQTIHDLLAKTIAVDIRSQKFFNNEQELLDFKSQQAAEEAEKKAYF